MLGFLILIVIGGVTDVGHLLLTGGMGGGLIVCGILAGEVAEEMRIREAGVRRRDRHLRRGGRLIGPGRGRRRSGLFDPTAVRWLSAIVFGGAGLAAAAGLVLLFLRREA